MKTWKLVSGILSCILFSFVSFQSCAAGLSNSLSDNGEVSGSAGILLAVLMLTAGIVSIAVRKSKGNGGNLAIFLIESLAAVIGYSNAGSFGDLKVWATWCAICGILAFVAMFTNKEKSVKE